MTINRALISTSNKKNLHILAPFLRDNNIEIISTGGTSKYLKQHGIKFIDISKFTGFPEMMGGRLKTLHPKVHGGILGRRGIDDEVMFNNDILGIDLVVCNLYNFEKAISTPGITSLEAIEQIDIGGPAMIRSAAKNHKDVVVLVDPDDYDGFISLYSTEFDVGYTQRLKYAQKVFAHTSKYDDMISQYLYHSIFCGLV